MLNRNATSPPILIQLSCHCTYFTVPSVAPIKVAAIAFEPTSVNVTWEEIPDITGDGIFIAYEVRYVWPLDNGQTGVGNRNTSGVTNHLVLNMLQECVQYNISVRAYTSQGPGPYSTAVVDSSLNSESCMQ